ncbi:MAG TPA: DNA repair protein RecN [Candidatus Ornithocaccomicrobium faecavium]|uniref:DNA repair protein RecN n=1 Tax=Candidatus Ornithocaccomicrobium faecavium TaxID=2840890 RepID=A0A9D1TC70_9FIRM|nr:DNA repair protein RecN [Candidatus Ornithocaccomicrobium faecavium]
MLLELSIKNVALIDELRVEFAPGLNVLTGETGAGKSILVDSVNLMLGGRAERDIVRTGTDKAVVQALFDVAGNSAALSLLAELGLEAEDGLIGVSRELTRSGRSVSRISGMMLPLSQVRRLTALLMDVHGQHEHQALLNPQRHREFLDEFGDAAHAALMGCVAEAYAALRDARALLAQTELDASERARRLDTLANQIAEIEAVKPKPGEEEALLRKYRLMQHAEKIAEGVKTAYALVYLGGGKTHAAQELLSRASSALGELAGIDERFGQLRDRIEEMAVNAREIGYELQDMLESMDYDERAAERVGDRLDAIHKLERKYGAQVEDVLAFLDAAKREYESLEKNDEQASELRKQIAAQEKALRALCGELTQSRTIIARRLEKMLVQELSELGMAGTQFEVRIAPEADFTAHGLDAVEFMISPNPGEPLKPLRMTASGGELSRIMLAMKAIAAEGGGVDSMVFDEIDTGVSGRMAQTVAEKLHRIAAHRQVLCITHLPQIAAMGDAHFVVEKRVEDGRTGSYVRRLDDDGRVGEIARLIGGSGETSIKHAQHLLASAHAQ